MRKMLNFLLGHWLSMEPYFFEILLLIVIFYYIMNLCRGGSNEENRI